jgi:hypothetical protein
MPISFFLLSFDFCAWLCLQDFVAENRAPPPADLDEAYVVDFKGSPNANSTYEYIMVISTGRLLLFAPLNEPGAQVVHSDNTFAVCKDHNADPDAFGLDLSNLFDEFHLLSILHLFWVCGMSCVNACECASGCCL